MSFVERFIAQCPYIGGSTTCTIGGSTVFHGVWILITVHVIPTIFTSPILLFPPGKGVDV